MTMSLLSRPPPHGAEIHRWSLTASDQLRTLRASLAQVLDALGSPGDGHLGETPERVALVATELVTNALQHGLPPALVRLLRHDGHLILDVTDHDTDHIPHVTAATVADHRGRGLAIVESLSAQVGWYTTAATKHVWASFPVTAAH